MEKLTQKIKSEAQHLGFSLVGVTTPDSPLHLDAYQNWLKAGYHAGMVWMGTERAIHRRSDPCSLLPECQSILVLGMPYPPSYQDQEDGKVSSYAWNEDYHHVIPPKLQALVEYIEVQVGRPVPNRFYTDTGPVLEREFAVRAGLGWIGKNTCLIHPRGGSYFFLAEIFLGLPLVPDQPFSNYLCGSCTRCLDACPTGSLRAPYTLDANLCVAYLTIELRESIPRQLRPLLGEWIFGCDICQQVCPWNIRFASSNNVLDEFSFASEHAPSQLIDELMLSPQAFNRKFKDSPVKRAKRRGYLRNITIALGNRGNIEAVPALKMALNDEEPLVRSHAAWALGQIGGKIAWQALKEAHKGEQDHQVQEEIQLALEESR